MAETVWTTGRLTPVYHPVGKRADGELMLKRANFDLMQWAAVPGGKVSTYITTLVGGGVASADVEDENQGEQLGRIFGYYNLNAVIIEPYEMGGMTDNWMGVHSFGYM